MKNMNFPEGEIKQLKSRLGAGKPIYTTRIAKEVGKYRKNAVVNNSVLGLLKVKKVMTLRDIKKHPFFKDLTKKQLKEIGDQKYQVIELEKHKMG
jgi:hypothetical protein